MEGGIGFWMETKVFKRGHGGSIANDNDNMVIGLCKSATRRDVDNLVAAARFGENKVESRSSFRAASFSAFPVVEGHQHNESFRRSQRKPTGASSTQDLDLAVAQCSTGEQVERVYDTREFSRLGCFNGPISTRASLDEEFSFPTTSLYCRCAKTCSRGWSSTIMLGKTRRLYWLTDVQRWKMAPPAPSCSCMSKGSSSSNL